MPKKVKDQTPYVAPQVYVAQAAFTVVEGGVAVEYQAGEEFIPPSDWEVVNNHPTLANKPGMLFAFQTQVAQKRGAGGRLEPILDTRTISLPVNPA